MNYVSIGDLAQTFQTRRQTFQVKTELQRLSLELSTGRKTDISTKSTGDFSPIVGIERAIRATTAYETPLAETNLLAQSMQSAYATMQTHSDEMSGGLLTAGNSQNSTMIDAAAVDGETRFTAIVALFNTRVADRYAFAGTATDAPALADAATILADLNVAITGLTTAADVETAVDAWFDTPGGGFDTVAYVGSPNALGPIRVSEHDTVDLSITASDDSARAALKGFAIAALVSQGALQADIVERAALTKRAGEVILTAQSDIANVRAVIGSAEARMHEVELASSAELFSLESARLEIVAADPYETALQLEAVRVQLETVFSMTARLSRLSLMEYLR